MRIVLATRLFHPHIGGVETHVKRIAEELMKAGHDPVVVTSAPRDGSTHLAGCNVRVLVLREYGSSLPVSFPSPRLGRIISALEPDVVHVHNAHNLFFAMACLSTDKRIPLVLTPHYHRRAHTPSWDALMNLYTPVLSSCVRRADRIIAVSPEERDIMARQLHPGASKLVVIPNGVDFRELEEAKKTRQRGRDGILYVGRFEPHKNVDKIIHAYARIRKVVPYAALTLVGPRQGSEGILRLLGELHLRDEVRVLIDLSRGELLREYASHEIFVMPSEIEAYSIATAEAIAMGLTTIVSYTSGLKWYCDSGLAEGIAVPVDHAHLAAKILDVFSKPPSARILPGALVDWTEVASETVEVYEEAISLRRQRDESHERSNGLP